MLKLLRGSAATLSSASSASAFKAVSNGLDCRRREARWAVVGAWTSLLLLSRTLEERFATTFGWWTAGATLLKAAMNGQMKTTEILSILLLRFLEPRGRSPE